MILLSFIVFDKFRNLIQSSLIDLRVLQFLSSCHSVAIK